MLPLNPLSIVVERTLALIGLLSCEPLSPDSPHWTNIPYLFPLCSLRSHCLFLTLAFVVNLILAGTSLPPRHYL